MNRLFASACIGIGTLADPDTVLGQADSVYRSAYAAAGRATTLGIYGNLGKDCAVGVTPEVMVKTRPTHGALIVRSTKVKTKPTNRCPNLEVPIQAVLYQGSTNFVGPDEVVFEIRLANGKVQAHTVKINVLRGNPAIKVPDAAAKDL